MCMFVCFNPAFGCQTSIKLNKPICKPICSLHKIFSRSRQSFRLCVNLLPIVFDFYAHETKSKSMNVGYLRVICVKFGCRCRQRNVVVREVIRDREPQPRYVKHIVMMT